MLHSVRPPPRPDTTSICLRVAFGSQVASSRFQTSPIALHIEQIRNVAQTPLRWLSRNIYSCGSIREVLMQWASLTLQGHPILTSRLSVCCGRGRSRSLGSTEFRGNVIFFKIGPADRSIQFRLLWTQLATMTRKHSCRLKACVGRLPRDMNAITRDCYVLEVYSGVSRIARCAAAAAHVQKTAPRLVSARFL